MNWEELRSFPTVRDHISNRGLVCSVHESVYRSFQILEEVKRMIDRGDSQQTISAFIEWAEGEPHDA